MHDLAEVIGRQAERIRDNCRLVRLFRSEAGHVQRGAQCVFSRLIEHAEKDTHVRLCYYREFTASEIGKFPTFLCETRVYTKEAGAEAETEAGTEAGTETEY